MNDYLLYNKSRLSSSASVAEGAQILVSSFNSSQRVRQVFNQSRAESREWIVLPEYEYASADLPEDAPVHKCEGADEAEALGQYLSSLLPRLTGRLAIDITGFLNQYVVVLLALLQRSGLREVEFIYGEPARYRMRERTQFSDESVMKVRQISGFEGMHGIDTASDLLILGMGYESRLAGEVANYKDNTKKILLFGLPSLRPDMYQESLLCSDRIAETIGADGSDPNHFRFAPAHDPFVTAGILSETVRQHRKSHPNSNIYLAPLATKAQALGFAIYYLRESQGTPTSILYPYCRRQMQATSDGLAGTWSFRVEFPLDGPPP